MIIHRHDRLPASASQEGQLRPEPPKLSLQRATISCYMQGGYKSVSSLSAAACLEIIINYKKTKCLQLHCPSHPECLRVKILSLF